MQILLMHHTTWLNMSIIDIFKIFILALVYVNNTNLCTQALPSKQDWLYISQTEGSSSITYIFYSNPFESIFQSLNVNMWIILQDDTRL